MVFAHDGEEEADGELGDGVGGVGGYVDDGEAEGGGGGDVDVVGASALGVVLVWCVLCVSSLGLLYAERL